MRRKRWLVGLKTQVMKGAVSSVDLLTNIKSVGLPVNYLKEILDFSLDVYGLKRNHLFPSGLPEIRRMKLTYTETSLENELRVNLCLMEKYAAEINKFSHLKSQFEKLLILGRYDEASAVLDTIEASTCSSVWAIESRFLVKQYAFGLEQNKEFLDTVNKQNSDITLAYLADFCSFKVESSTTPSQYQNRVIRFLNNLNNADHVVPASYFRFKLLSRHIPSQTDLEHVLFLESNSSIIDIFLTTIRVLQQVAVHQNLKSNLPEDIRQQVDLLSTLINSSALRNLNLCINLNSGIRPETSQAQFFQIVDCYTEGRYDSVYEDMVPLLTEHANSIQVYELFTKCMMYLNSEPFTTSESVQNRLINAIWHVQGKTEKTIEARMYLEHLVMVFGNMDISYELKYLVDQSFSIHTDSTIQRWGELCSHYVTPRFLRVYDDEKEAEEFLTLCREMFGPGSTIALYNSRPDLTSTLIDVPVSRLSRYEADTLADKESDFHSAIKVLEKVTPNSLEKHLTTNYLYEQNTVRLFNYYLSLNDVSKCLEILVSSYLEGEYLTLRMDKQRLLKITMTPGISNDVKKQIDYPIAVYLCAKRNYSQSYRALYNYVRAHGFDKPSELSNLEADASLDKLIFLFENICIPEIMDSFRIFKSPLEVRDERINICSYLSTVNPQKSHDYAAELELLKTELAVSKQVGQLEQAGRLFVDINGLREDPDNMSESAFERYTVIGQFMNNLKLVDIHNRSSMRQLGEYGQMRNSGSSLEEAEYVMFKEAFMELRHEFLFNEKFGLDSSLSTRIRHGVLKNEIRNAFDEYNLLLVRKDKTSASYEWTGYWSDVFRDNLLEGIREPLFRALGELSKKVDDLIADIVDNWVRIKTENSSIKNGLLDFTLDSEWLEHVFSSLRHVTDFNRFFETIIIYLTARTQMGLVFIQSGLRSHARESLVKYLDDLISNVSVIGKQAKSHEEKTFIRQLVSNIIKCKTDIQNVLERVIKWFALMENVEIYDYPMSILVETLQRYGRWGKLNIQAEIKSQMVLKGHTFMHLLDILDMLFDNAVSRSQIQDKRKLKVNVDINETDVDLEIVVANNLDPTVDLHLLNHKISDIEKQIQDVEQIKKQSVAESNSGIMKICKIILFQLQQEAVSLELKADQRGFTVRIVLPIENIRRGGFIHEYSLS